MLINAECDFCGFEVKTHESDIGRTVKCPVCCEDVKVANEVDKSSDAPPA